MKKSNIFISKLLVGFIIIFMFRHFIFYILNYSLNFNWLITFWLEIIIKCCIIGCVIFLIINNRDKIVKFIKKYTLSKIIFIISFIPYVLTIIGALSAMFTGTEFMYGMIYGVDAFVLCLAASLIAFLPLYIIVAIYQVIFIVFKLMKKFNIIKRK